MIVYDDFDMANFRQTCEAENRTTRQKEVAFVFALLIEGLHGYET